jgi:hypothetical protein
MFGDSLQAILVIGGFIVLGAAIAWAMARNRVSRRQEARTEDATRHLYDEGTVDRTGGG